MRFRLASRAVAELELASTILGMLTLAMISVLASQGPQTWEQMVRSAASNTNWDERPAGGSFIARLEAMSSAAVHNRPNMPMPSQMLISREQESVIVDYRHNRR